MVKHGFSQASKNFKPVLFHLFVNNFNTSITYYISFSYYCVIISFIIVSTSYWLKNQFGNKNVPKGKNNTVTEIQLVLFF